MRLVLSVEAIHPPLAGIGRYAWELATRCRSHPGIESVRFISHGRWVDLPKIEPQVSPASSVPAQSAPVEVQLNYKGRMRRRIEQIPNVLRRQVRQSSFLSRAYGKVAPLLANMSLRSQRDAVFHGPNYFVPSSGLPSLVTVHDLSMYRFPQWHPKARIERILESLPQSIERSKLILTDSEAIRLEVIEQFGLPEKKVKTVLLGVDEIYHPRSEEEVRPVLEKFGLRYNAYSFFVSTIEPRKNLRNLIAAYRLLPLDVRRQYPLVLAGGRGWESDEIHADIVAAQNESWLKYLGFVEQHEMPALYAGCRLFTYPSWYEGFGLPIAEAMASGVPVVTSNNSSMPEVAGGAALLVEPADVEQISAAIHKGLDDSQWRLEAIAKGRARAAQLTWDSCVANTVDAYKYVHQMSQ